MKARSGVPRVQSMNLITLFTRNLPGDSLLFFIMHTNKKLSMPHSALFDGCVITD
jgi:hypothetical protein